ncbi:bifunctional tetrahydrofolate synthase/dihydrofolate synthase [Denitromonas iodatirespirans]|uniref:Dihydrofolate synthase/folylpolyglutamate synthase n=1 Tax=Denitromonas iodatirespirans TaxID=2795389 RepID=A0A944D936_DENI1|nr:bifunctional tetrahydrofolate synthase/dihydrofolate synthase [Denitromonas iodatirespirans]MBT0960781.1 bifunctional tetrahydrofolate synthase/dihydrofolate synthase [Denitromonas iodatirespirans]
MPDSDLPGDLAGWLALIEARHGQRIELGLARVALVRDAMGLSSGALVITVAGTNGKGSTCAFLEAICLAAGYRVGLYTSPHLVRYNERVRINGQEADDATLAAAFAQVERARGDTYLTYFEHGTLAAWACFAEAALDVIILEVGLGGRLDATNVFDADCAIVTSIAMDHMDYLGDTREAIGREKAGIFRGGRPAICADPLPPASIEAVAKEVGAVLQISGRDFGFSGDRTQWTFWGPGVRRGGLAYPALRGANQLLNASAAMAALEAVRDRLPVPMQAVREGMMLVELPGRFQTLPGQPAVVLDVAHNEQAVGVLAENLANMGYYPETWAVVGMMGDKAIEASLARIQDRVDHWLPASLPGPRGLSADALAARMSAAGIAVGEPRYASPADAYRAARAAAQDGDRILVFGSFLTVADALAAIRAER